MPSKASYHQCDSCVDAVQCQKPTKSQVPFASLDFLILKQRRKSFSHHLPQSSKSQALLPKTRPLQTGCPACHSLTLPPWLSPALHSGVLNVCSAKQVMFIKTGGFFSIPFLYSSNVPVSDLLKASEIEKTLSQKTFPSHPCQFNLSVGLIALNYGPMCYDSNMVSVCLKSAPGVCCCVGECVKNSSSSG